MSEAGPPPTIAMRLPFFARRPRHAVLDVVLEVGGDALQPADRDRRLLDAAAAAGGLARAIAGASQDTGKHVRPPIDHVGVAVAAFGDQADVFGNGRMRGTGPLAVDNFVKVIGRRNISRFHSYHVRARAKNDAALRFVCERSDSVLVVIAWDHRDILLEPFNMIHKGNFPRSPAFTAWRYNVNEIRLMRQCSNRAKRELPAPAAIETSAVACAQQSTRAGLSLALASAEGAAAPDTIYAVIAEARSATAFITASRTPGS